MRVIGGTYRSRQLVAPRGAGTRPTSDRLRETLFNILAPRIAGARFADLYAGTGAVGIEALSRGASQVWFAEKSEPAVAAIRSNLNSLKITSGFVIDDRGAGALLERLAKSAQKAAVAPASGITAGSPVQPGATQLLDIVFLDPPWEAAGEYVATLHLLGSVRGRAMLAPDAIIIAEHSSKSLLAVNYGNLAQTRALKQGDAALTFFNQVAN